MKPLSASQMGLFDLCPTRWGKTYIEGRREPPGQGALDGTTIHSMLEEYVRDGVIPDRTNRLGAVAYEMCKNLPPKGSIPAEDVEAELNLVVDGLVFRGRVDLREPGRITDQKSVSSLRYAKTAETLEEDLQALIYARWMDTDGELVWNYGQTKGTPKTRKVVLKVLRDEVRERFDRVVVPLAHKIQEAYIQNDVAALPKNWNACKLYPPKGCKFFNECERDNMTENATGLSLMEKLAANKAAKAAGAIAPIRPATEGEALEPVRDTPRPYEPEGDIINPPESPKRRGRPKKTTEEAAAAKETYTPANAPKATVAAEVLVAHGVQLEQPSPVVGAEGTVVTPMARVVPTTTTTKPIGTLYLDCMPLSGTVTHAYELIARAAEEARNDLELHHVMLAEFGKGAGVLASQLRENIKAGPYIEQLVLVCRTAEGRAVQQELCSLAERVVIGL